MTINTFALLARRQIFGLNYIVSYYTYYWFYIGRFQLMGFLSGKILTATPQMDDPRFRHCVVLIVEHDEDHAMGIIINKQLKNLTLKEIGDQIEIDTSVLEDKDAPPLYDGGPCDLERGFIVHTNNWFDATTIDINTELSYSISKDILESIINHQGPEKSLIAMGYTGWSAGQLEEEIANNIWLIGDCDEILLFSDIAQDLKWHRSLSLLKVDPARLSTLVGNA